MFLACIVYSETSRLLTTLELMYTWAGCIIKTPAEFYSFSFSHNKMSSCPRAVNKKAVTYHKWCGSSESGLRGSPLSIPSYLYKDLDKYVLRNFSRLRLRAHHLRVESCKWHGGSSICDKRECGEVQDEKHVLFFCKCAEVCELRMRLQRPFWRNV